jgi:hypothetical protein
VGSPSPHTKDDRLVFPDHHYENHVERLSAIRKQKDYSRYSKLVGVTGKATSIKTLKAAHENTHVAGDAMTASEVNNVTVTGFDIVLEKITHLVSNGLRPATSAQQAAGGADLVILSLPSLDVVLEAVEGK